MEVILWRGALQLKKPKQKQKNPQKTKELRSGRTCSYKWSALGQWIRLVLADRNVEVMDWQSLCDLSMGLHYCAIVEFLSQTASCLSISKSQVRTSGKAEGACSEKSFSQCTRVPKMSSAWVMISLQGVDIRVILRYNGTVQDNTKFVAFYCYSLWALARWPAMQQLQQLFTFPSHRSQVRTNQGSAILTAKPCAVTIAEGKKKNLELFGNTQRSSSRDAVSQGTFCQWSKREKWKEEK